MHIEANSPDEYMAQISEERVPYLKKLRDVIKNNIPDGFEEQISYGMIGFVVPKSIYPKGYHCNPELPLPFVNIASQKNYIALYHSGIYADPTLLNWFVNEYPKHSKYKLDMGKSCVRFKNLNDIPYELIGELIKKITPSDWIKTYENNIKK
ncbi:MAG TPA: DUF1801 domain-containing protein [Flavobacteriaceae bacterium]|nr:DUF1801 domain-containing protein [Flavobacteriaceae bacterium]